MGAAAGIVFQRNGLPSVAPGSDPSVLISTPWATDQAAEAAATDHRDELQTEWGARWDGDVYQENLFRHKDGNRFCVWNFDMEEILPPVGALQEMVQDDIWLEGPSVAPAARAKPVHGLETTVSGRKAAAMMRKPAKRKPTKK